MIDPDTDHEPTDARPATPTETDGTKPVSGTADDEATNTRTDTVLEIEELSVTFETDRATVRALREVSFDVRAGEIFGIVGESGSGKTVTARSILGLLDAEATITGGEIRYDGRDLTTLDDGAFRRLRGDEISMVFQDPLSSLNPVLTIGSQVEEAVTPTESWMNYPLGRLLARLLARNAQSDARADVVEILEQVGIPNPADRLDSYPHEFSGGMRQRVLIAIAIAARPTLLIVDEPTTALDVTTQANVLQLLNRLRAETEMSILIISHDLGVVAQLADRTAIMYAGEIMELAPTRAAFKETRHPYTNELLKSLPQTGDETEELHSIEGTVPSLLDVPDGCIFSDRCPNATDQCRTQPPIEETDGHQYACHHPITDDDRYFSQT